MTTTPHPTPSPRDCFNALVGVVQVVALAAWWAAATARYLRLPHAFGVVAAMFTITMLIVAIIYAVTYRPY
jgi:hypothetical protein